MSNFLTGLAQLNPQVKRHNGGTSTLTLDQSGTTNATLLFVNGVAQTPGTDFNVSGATLTTTSALPAGTNIATTIQYFNTGIVNAPADNSVTGAKLDVSLVQGDVLTATGTDTLARLAKGTANQKLSMNSAANAVEWQTVASSGWTFVSSVTASASANVSFTSMTTGYDYLLVATNCKNATDNVDLKIELGITGPTYRTSGYRSGNGFHYVASSYGSSANITADIRLTGVGVGNVDPERYDFALNIIDPANSGSNTSTFGLINWFNTSNGMMVGQSYGIYTSDEAHTALKFYTSSGNITSGLFKLYKRPNA